MYQETVISMADLRYVGIECPHCRTRVILDMKETAALAVEHGIFAPRICPGCRTPYDSAIQPNIDNLQRAYQSLLEIADSISFRGEPVPTSPASGGRAPGGAGS